MACGVHFRPSSIPRCPLSALAAATLSLDFRGSWTERLAGTTNYHIYFPYFPFSLFFLRCRDVRSRTVVLLLYPPLPSLTQVVASLPFRRALLSLSVCPCSLFPNPLPPSPLNGSLFPPLENPRSPS